MKRKSLVCAVALAFLLVSLEWGEAQEKVRIAISNFSASYISMHIAQKRGYYAEEGMLVEIILMAGLTSSPQMERGRSLIEIRQVVTPGSRRLRNL